ncbi:hypothetical protein L0663_17400 [Dyadobacter sp. CY107]|uniref:hypothetical protein n=1 Tax=Dyadobacter fanqingshengii TaxID=2906443 RepID=UPI001F2BD78E|nr:hypothetical protein [Dyadobacter fanqingshengii]MCF2505175.1 hypothetical protein [Dyadobacter fanqingshengii]
MKLFDLICLLILGVFCFWVNYIVTLTTSRKRWNKGKLRSKQEKKMSKAEIKKELDNLLVQYNQETINEQQYRDRADPLIGKLSDQYSEAVRTYL